jgi:hypothetical protein
MTDEDKIKIVIESLTSNALGDVKRASGGGSKMGAFILCSCLIDAMAGFVKGADTTRTDYISFVRDYLTKYDPNSLYTDLRCKLVHSYSEGGSYLFVDAKPQLHFTQQNSKTIINLEDFIADIEKSLETLRDKLSDVNEIALRQNAVTRFDANGIIQVFSVNFSLTSHPASGSAC